jgi:hypothetical protein
MIDVLYFPLQIISDNPGEFRMRKPMRRPGADGKKAARQLMLSLCAPLEQLDTVCDAVFDGLIIASLEM